MQKLLILCALEQELPSSKNPYRDQTFYTGVGKVNAAIMASSLIDSLQPDLVINLGTAGSCNAQLKGIIECGIFKDRDDSKNFISDSTICFDKNLYTVSTGDNFASEEVGDCDVVDMEAYAIAKVCKGRRVAFKCYKYITDYVNSDSEKDWNKNVSKGLPFFLEKINDYFKNAV
jgi:adenosylhomocysteine nucleosidase